MRQRISKPLAALVAFSIAAVLWAAGSSEGPIVRQARELIDAGKLKDAATLLRTAVADNPASVQLRINLGYVYELLGQQEEAVQQYAAVRTMAPSNPYASDRLRKIFFGRHFPRWVNVRYLSSLPVSMVRFQVRRPDGAVVDAAVTVSELFPEQMRTQGKPVSIVVPPQAEDGERCQFNRVVYAYAALNPGGVKLVQRGQVYYPSALLSVDGRNYQPLALSLARMLARMSTYLDLIAPAAKSGEAVKVWLCEKGPAGGEEHNGQIFLYRVDRLRPGEEWQRELAHELGHARLPALHGYREPEPSLAGTFGEAYLLAALAHEAEAASGHKWPDKEVKRWLDALWPLGSADFSQLLDQNVFSALRLWQREGPYPHDPASATAARMACGFLLWVYAAHGPKALAHVLSTDVGTLPVLVGRYVSWLTEGSGKIQLAAAAGCGFCEALHQALPTSLQSVPLSRTNLWQTLCFVPEGAWQATSQSGERLLVRWVPRGAKPGQEWRRQLISKGEWGVIEVAPTSEKSTTLRKLVLTPAPRA